MLTIGLIIIILKSSLIHKPLYGDMVVNNSERYTSGYNIKINSLFRLTIILILLTIYLLYKNNNISYIYIGIELWNGLLFVKPNVIYLIYLILIITIIYLLIYYINIINNDILDNNIIKYNLLNNNKNNNIYSNIYNNTIKHNLLNNNIYSKLYNNILNYKDINIFINNNLIKYWNILNNNKSPAGSSYELINNNNNTNSLNNNNNNTNELINNNNNTNDLINNNNQLSFLINVGSLGLNKEYKSNRSEDNGENILVLIIYNIISGIILTQASNILMIYLMIELQSFSIYVIIGIYKKSYKTLRLALTYFIIGTLGSIIILLGITKLYMCTNLLNLADINKLLLCSYNLNNYNILYSYLIIFIGLFVKIGIVPFNNWLLNIYFNTTTIITLWISIVVKLNLFNLLFNLPSIVPIINNNNYNINNNNNNIISIIYDNNIIEYININYIIIIFGIVTIVFGSIGGLAQINLKRIILYSGLVNSGYILLSTISSNNIPYDNISILAYNYNLIQYSLTHILLLYILYLLNIILCNNTLNINLNNINSNNYNNNNNKPRGPRWEPRGGDRNYNNNIYIYELIGLINKNKLISISLIVVIFSLIGTPPLVGFYGKYYIIKSLLSKGYWLLTIILIIISLITTIFYIFILNNIIKPNNNNNIKFIYIGKSNNILISILTIIIIILPSIDLIQIGLITINTIWN